MKESNENICKYDIQKGKVRRAAKKAEVQSVEDAAFLEMAVAAGYTPKSLNGAVIPAASPSSPSSSSSSSVGHVLLNNVGDVPSATVGHTKLMQLDAAADSDSDKDDDDIADGHTTAAVPVDDESDLTNLHDALNTLPLLEPLPPLSALSTLPAESVYPEENDYSNPSTHPLSRKRNRPAKDL